MLYKEHILIKGPGTVPVTLLLSFFAVVLRFYEFSKSKLKKEGQKYFMSK